MGQNSLASESLSCMMYVTTASRFALESVLRSSTYACVFRSLLLLVSCENAGTAITSGRTNNACKKALFTVFISFHLSYFATAHKVQAAIQEWPEAHSGLQSQEECLAHGFVRQPGKLHSGRWSLPTYFGSVPLRRGRRVSILALAPSYDHYVNFKKGMSVL